MGKLIDLTGQEFGRLAVVERVANNKRKEAMWLCRCECGNEVIVRGTSLRDGNTKSCGCLQKEAALKVGKNSATHHSYKTRLYNIWRSMKQRCYNPCNNDYPNYGGRGITIYEEWKSNFGTFREWAMANGYRDNLTIDRIDVNGNYEPSNCRWATMKEQGNNRRSNHLITFNGESHTIAEWARITGISYAVLKNRFYHLKWSPEKALTTTNLRLPHRH